MSDIKYWLKGQGLSIYSDLFAEQKIDLDVLSELTEVDLKELNIPIGDRKRLLRAIASQCEQTENSEVSNWPVEQNLDAERRQLTVMFCDLVGSTELSSRLDPEDIREIICAYQNSCAKVIAEFDGYIAKFMGDGILVYFGYPKAHENDAERAVHAGLGIIEALNDTGISLDTSIKVDLRVRIGIDTGLVIVGDLIGEGASEEANIVGETPNLASRLQTLAQPNQIVIGPGTYKLVQDVFTFQELGKQNLKGFSEQIETWSIESRRHSLGSIKKIHDTFQTPLIGRQEERGLLIRSWETSKEKHGQVVLIQGEGGIGKSRLVDALREQMSGEKYQWVINRCSPYRMNSTLHPIIENLKQSMHWKADDTVEQKIDKLETLLSSRKLSSGEALPLYADLMSVSLPVGRFPTSEDNAKRKREQTLDYLSGWLLEEAEHIPTIQIWEDLHWADPTTLELLGIFIAQSPTVAMLNILTYRPEFVPPWTMRSHMTPITLNRLEYPEIKSLIAHQANNKPLPVEVVNHIVEKSDGVPLYVEELTKAVIESDYLLEQQDRYLLLGTLSDITIPTTLQDSLMSRLDQSPLAREIAQLGSAIGREFDYQMLCLLSPQDEEIIKSGLQKLVEDEILYQRGRPPRSRYIFKHALIQDSAYESLLKTKRSNFHKQIAILMEEQFPELAATQPELLAHHFIEAGSTEKALEHSYQAGKIAAGRSANEEAVIHFEKSLDLLSELPETTERKKLELELQVALGPALVATRGFAYEGVGVASERAWELCEQLEDSTHLPLVLRGRQVFHFLRGELKESLEFAKRLHNWAKKHNDQAFLIGSYHALGQSQFFLGRLTDTRTTVFKGIELFDPEQHRITNWSGGQPGEQCYHYGAFAVWMLGDPDESVRLCDNALRLAKDLPNPVNLINTITFAAMLYVFLRNADIVIEHATKAIELSKEHGNQTFLGHGMVLNGWAKSIQDNSVDGIHEIRKGINIFHDTGARAWIPYFLGLLAEAHVQKSQVSDGLSAIDEAMTLAEQTEQYVWQSELYRIKGDVLLGSSSNNLLNAERCYQKGLEIARRQNAKSLGLRNAIGLVRCRKNQNKKAGSNDNMESICRWFTEECETSDPQIANQLLKELS